MEERRTGSVELTDPPVRVGFRASGHGSEIQVTCVVTLLGSAPAYLAITTSRTAGRLADLEFVASVDGRMLPDPAGDLPFLGGPATTRRLAPGETFEQTVPLSSYVDLRDAPPGRLTLVCRRRVGLARTSTRAFTDRPVLAEVTLLLDLGP